MKGAALALLRELLAARGPVKDTPRGFLACCPAHPDASPSLNVDQGEKGAVVQCRSGGCSTESIAEALGITRAQLFDEQKGERRREPRSKPKAREEKKLEGWATPAEARAWWASKRTAHNVSAFHYADAKGEPVFVVLRADPFSSEDKKSFAQLVLEGGRWKMGAPEGERPLYLLREMLAADPVEPVLLVEGEQKAELLVRLGFTATTSAQGSKSPRATDWSSLRGRRIVAFSDNDEAGRSYVEAARKLALAAGAAGFAVAQLDGLAEGEDVVDWAERIDGDTARTQLAALVEAAVETMEQREEEDAHGPEWRAFSFDEMLAQPPVEWLVDSLLPRVGVALLASEPGAGKSFLALDIAMRIASNGSTFFGKSIRGHGAVAYVALEGAQGMTARTRAWRASYWQEKIPHPVHVIEWKGAAPLTEGQADFGKELRRYKRKNGSLALLVVDTLTLGLAGANENDSGEVGEALRFLSSLCSELRCCVLLLHHVRKDGKLGRPSRMTLADVRGSSALAGNADSVLGLERREGREERALLVLKQKDGEAGAPLWFRLISQATGATREDGTPETSCVVACAEPPTDADNDEAREEEKEQRLDKKAGRDAAWMEKNFDTFAKRLLVAVESEPGLPKSELRKSLGKNLQRVGSVIERMLAKGLLVSRRRGNAYGIFLPETAEEARTSPDKSGQVHNEQPARTGPAEPPEEQGRTCPGLEGMGEKHTHTHTAAAGGEA